MVMLASKTISRAARRGTRKLVEEYRAAWEGVEQIKRLGVDGLIEAQERGHKRRLNYNAYWRDQHRTQKQRRAYA